MISSLDRRRTLRQDSRGSPPGSEAGGHPPATAEESQARDDFMRAVAHDLRAPLRAIRRQVDTLETAVVEDRSQAVRECIANLRGQTSRMSSMFDGLLRLSQAGRDELAMRPVDCAALIRSVISELMRPPGRCPVFEVDADVVCGADPDLLRQVFANLIDNAVKYSAGREAPRIEIAARDAGAELIFTVRDNGVGFDPRRAGWLFQVFHRLHDRTRFEGCGVGLSIVRCIVERHGGRVWADATVDHGAAFHFSLPARRSKDGQPPRVTLRFPLVA